MNATDSSFALRVEIIATSVFLILCLWLSYDPRRFFQRLSWGRVTLTNQTALAFRLLAVFCVVGSLFKLASLLFGLS